MEYKLTEQMNALFQGYEETLARLREESPLADGIFGVGGSTKSDRCHGELAEKMDALLTRAAGEGLDPAEAEAALRLLMERADRPGTEPLIATMMAALHRSGCALVGSLTPEQAAALAGEYAERFPRRTRLPVQQQLLDALLARGGKAPEKKKLFSFLHR